VLPKLLFRCFSGDDGRSFRLSWVLGLIGSAINAMKVSFVKPGGGKSGVKSNTSISVQI